MQRSRSIDGWVPVVAVDRAQRTVAVRVQGLVPEGGVCVVTVGAVGRSVCVAVQPLAREVGAVRAVVVLPVTDLDVPGEVCRVCVVAVPIVFGDAVPVVVDVKGVWSRVVVVPCRVVVIAGRIIIVAGRIIIVARAR
jgi:hypothetical protein